MTNVESNTQEKVKLTDKQELFCKLFATDKLLFGNGTRAYLEAYPDSSPEAARRSASDLLTNPDILKRIDELMDLDGFNDVAVDRQLAVVIAQNADFSSKVAAIREYNKLKARVTEKLDLSSKDGSMTPKAEKTDIDAMMELVKAQTAKEAEVEHGKPQA